MVRGSTAETLKGFPTNKLLTGRDANLIRLRRSPAPAAWNSKAREIVLYHWDYEMQGMDWNPLPKPQEIMNSVDLCSEQ